MQRILEAEVLDRQIDRDIHFTVLSSRYLFAVSVIQNPRLEVSVCDNSASWQSCHQTSVDNVTNFW